MGELANCNNYYNFYLRFGQVICILLHREPLPITLCIHGLLISGLLLESRSSKFKEFSMAQPLLDQILKAMAERRPKPFVFMAFQKKDFRIISSKYDTELILSKIPSTVTSCWVFRLFWQSGISPRGSSEKSLNRRNKP